MRGYSFVGCACVLLLLLCSMKGVCAQGFTVGPSTNPAPVTNDSISHIGSIATDMYNRWSLLDSSCDPRAVFAVAYLYMTAVAKVLIQNGYFDDGNKMVGFIANFAGRYVGAFDAWQAGNMAGVSQPWMVYYNFQATKKSDVTEDLTIGMNAHINYDLAIAGYQQGYADPQWRNDYYRVNDLMAMLDSNVTHALGRYDAQFYNTDPASQAYFNFSIDFVTSWRTNAYSQIQQYQAASTPIAVQTLMTTFETAATTYATSIAIPYPYYTNTTRVPYCQANHYPLII